MSEINFDLPLRPTARVIIKNKGLICICKVVRNGVVIDYNVPGGGVEDGDTMEQTVVKEALEEVGIAIVKVKPMGIRLAKHHKLSKPERNLIWSGTDTHYFEADFKTFDRSHLNADGDAMEFEWMEPAYAIQCIKSQNSRSPFNEIKIEAISAIRFK